jgi:mono/diheme cytochrome c family protein
MLSQNSCSRVSNLFLALLLAVLLASCNERVAISESDTSSQAIAQPVSYEIASISRWYDGNQLAQGRQIFAQNCARCHGTKAEGLVLDWRVRLDDGAFPPPPLNGSAHAWHHPLEMLLRVIDYGGEEMGGKMPAFIDVLEQAEKLAAIAYFQSFWSDEIYQKWMQMGGVN